jgi:hypothetical protein
MVISLSIEVSFRRDAPNNHIGSLRERFVAILWNSFVGNLFLNLFLFSVFIC